MRKSLGADGFAQVRHCRRVAEEVLKAHGMSLWHLGRGRRTQE
jgi:hypothetical protein